MEPIKIDARVANTKILRMLVRESRELEYTRLIPQELLDKLDPNGNHILFPRPDGRGIEKEAPPNPVGYTKVSSVSLGLLDNLPCEVYLKLRGKKEATTVMLDVSLQSMLALHTLEEARALTGAYRMSDGDNRYQR